MAASKKKKSKKKASGKKKIGMPVGEFAKALKAAAEDDRPPIDSLIAAGITSPLILIGEESLRLRRAITMLKNKIFSDDSIEITSYYGPELSAAANIKPLFEALATPSLFAPVQLVIINDAHDVRAGPADTISKNIGTISPQTFLILTSNAINQRTPLLNRVKDDATIVGFETFSDRELKAWIKKEVSTQGADSSIDEDAVDILVKSYGNDLNLLENEIGKLLLLSAGETTVTKQHVKECLLKGPEHTSFELFIQMAKKNVALTSRLTKNLMEQGSHPLQINGFLSRAINSCIEAQSNPNDRSFNWFRKQLGQAPRLFKEEELIASLEVLKTLDLNLKSSSFEPSLLLENATQRIASRHFG